MSQEFWFNTVTGQVEVGRQSDVTQLMGPYSTHEQAQNALATAARKSEAWDDEDKEWRGES